VWLYKSLRKETKIKIFNACVKSVLLYGCETWLVTNEIQRKIQTFVNRCLGYILRTWWPNIISNKDLWKITGQEDINLEIRRRKFRWLGHTLRKEDGEIPTELHTRKLSKICLSSLIYVRNYFGL
jgi:hypothetical protein